MNSTSKQVSTTNEYKRHLQLSYNLIARKGGGGWKGPAGGGEGPELRLNACHTGLKARLSTSQGDLLAERGRKWLGSLRWTSKCNFSLRVLEGPRDVKKEWGKRGFHRRVLPKLLFFSFSFVLLFFVFFGSVRILTIGTKKGIIKWYIYIYFSRKNICIWDFRKAVMGRKGGRGD